MSNAPFCPDHQVSMKVSQFGGWYCPGKNEDGTYCKRKVKANPKTEQAPAAPQPPPTGTAAPGTYPQPPQIVQPSESLVPLAAACVGACGGDIPKTQALFAAMRAML